MANELRYRASIKDDVSGPLGRLSDKFEMIRKQGVTGFGLGVGASVGFKAMGMLQNAVGSAADAVVDFAFDSINAASDLAETMTKSQQIFGESSDEIEAWADTASDAFGQSKRQALDTASGFAGLFKTVGIELDQAAEMSKELTVLGSDLASFFNTDVQTAIDSLRSGLSGESEPLRKFNVFLSETAVSAKLAEMGIEKVGGQFTEGQKAAARYALILEQTEDAQGDFARTSDGLANTQRTLQAQLEDLSASIGEELIPVALALAGFLKDEVVPALQETTNWFKENEVVVDSFAGILETLFKGGTAAGFDMLKEKMAEAEEQTKASARALVDFRAGERQTGTATRNLAGATDKAADGLDDVGDEAQDARSELKKLEGAAEDALDSFIETTLGTKELKLRLADAKAELKENQRELEKLQKIKDPTKDQRDDIRETKLEIIDGKEEIIRATARLEAMGEVPMGRTEREIRQLIGPLHSVEAAAREAYSAIRQVSNTRSRINRYDGDGDGNVGVDGGRAGGGPAGAYQTLRVGEGTGSEIVQFGASGGYVTPESSPRSATGQPIILQVMLDGRVLAEATAPGVTAWQQDRQLLARA